MDEAIMGHIRRTEVLDRPLKGIQISKEANTTC